MIPKSGWRFSDNIMRRRKMRTIPTGNAQPN